MQELAQTLKTPVIASVQAMENLNYKWHEVLPGTGSNEQPYFRVHLFSKKHANVSEEAFHEHWKTTHAGIIMSLPGFSDVCLRYVQVRILWFSFIILDMH